MIKTNFDKWGQLSELNSGDKVLLTDGQIAEFVRLKQKKFIGVIDEKSYDIPVSMFVEVVDKVDFQEKEKQIQELQPNDVFYINKNGKAILYIFERFEKGKIVGVNPISKGRTIIDRDLFAGKVNDL
jgi:hypothetical protein